MTQAILDIRRGVTWLADQPEVDGERLGVFGISLGGITGALATTADPRIGQACLLLAGGDVGEILWESREAAPARRQWVANGGTREQLLALLKQVDPVTYRQGARGKRILMLNASDDEVVPKACTESLWEAFGRPRIVWYSGGHYSVGRHLFSALDEVGGFFAVAPSQP
jgi:dienelactone hydrolase